MEGEGKEVHGGEHHGGVALAILFFGAILFRDEFGHERHGHGVARGDRAQHGMTALDLSDGTFARQAMLIAELLRTEIFGCVQGDQGALQATTPQATPLESLERLQAAAFAQRRHRLTERRLKM
jgi:hypothetical protein